MFSMWLPCDLIFGLFYSVQMFGHSAGSSSSCQGFVAEMVRVVPDGGLRAVVVDIFSFDIIFSNSYTTL